MEKYLTYTLFEAATMKWQIPSDKELKKEYQIECVLKGLDYFENEEEFLEKIKSSKLETISEKDDLKIRNRSHTEDIGQLHSLISTYRSYPEFRNEKTLKELYDLIEKGGPCDAPIVVEENGKRTVFSGNTRMDIAFQLGKKVQAIIVEI